jgi:hypothetical protein
VAERWLEEQGLPPDQKEQIVNFLIQNSGGGPVPMQTQYVDPYTGTGYVPGAGGPMAGAGGPHELRVGRLTGSGRSGREPEREAGWNG